MIYLLPGDLSGRIIGFDVVESELHEGTTEITRHPVENGIAVTDHVRATPLRLQCVVYVSNHPIVPSLLKARGIVVPVPTGNPLATPIVLTFALPFDAVADAHAELDDLMRGGTVMQVVSSVRSYDDMVLERVSLPRMAGDSGGSISLDFTQLRFVEAGRVPSPPIPRELSGKPSANMGAQPDAGNSAAAAGGGAADVGAGSLAHQMVNSQGLSGVLGMLTGGG
jgi:hypothetical protein